MRASALALPWGMPKSARLVAGLVIALLATPLPARAQVALIKFTQTPTVGTAGQAMLGVTGVAVSVANNVNTSVASWQIDMAYSPPGSTVAMATMASANSNNTPAASFTPDKSGSYRVVLKVWAIANRVGTPNSTDIRVFAVPEGVNGFVRPPAQIFPGPLPDPLSGLAGNKPNEMNFSGCLFGYAGCGSDGLLDNFIATTDKRLMRSVSTIAALASIPDAGFVAGQIAYVATVGDFFAWHTGQALTTTATTVINGPAGQWTRMGIPNRAWRAQATWSIDESNVSGLASDENTCADDTHPCLNGDEFVRRMGTVVLAQATTVRWMSDTTHYSIDLSGISGGNQSATTPATNFPLVVIGVPTVVRSGTLTGATDAPWSVSDSALGTSWSASGCLSTSTGVRLIRKTDKTKYAMMGYEDVAKTAKTSPTNGFSETFGTAGTVSVSFATSDAYEVLSLPKFPRVNAAGSVPGFTGNYFMLLDMTNVYGGSVETRFCGWRAFGGFNAQQRAGFMFVKGGIMVAGGTFGGGLTTVFSRSIFLGGVMQTFAWTGDMNGLVNVVAKGGTLQVTHGSMGRLGIVYAFDCTGIAIQLTNLAISTIDQIHGSGNAGVIVDVRDSGCSLNSQSATSAFDATTSAAHPITIVGASKDYADLPFWSTNQNAGFVVN